MMQAGKNLMRNERMRVSFFAWETQEHYEEVRFTPSSLAGENLHMTK